MSQASSIIYTILYYLRADRRGVMSFEYVIVAACVVASVVAAFSTTNATGIGRALTTMINSITVAVTAV